MEIKMNKIVDFFLVVEKNDGDFIREVNRKISNGWDIIGEPIWNTGTWIIGIKKTEPVKSELDEIRKRLDSLETQVQQCPYDDERRKRCEADAVRLIRGLTERIETMEVKNA